MRRMRTRKTRRVVKKILFCLFIAFIFLGTLFVLKITNGAEEAGKADAIMNSVVAAQPKSQQSTINVWLGGIWPEPLLLNDKRPNKVIKLIALFGEKDCLRLKVEYPENNRMREYLILAKADSVARIWLKRRGALILEVKGENIISKDLEATGLAHRDLQRESFKRFSYELVEERPERWLIKATPKNDLGWHRVLHILKHKAVIAQVDVFENNELKKTILATSFWENREIVTPQGYVVFDKQGQRVSFLKLLDIEVNKEIKQGLFDPRNFQENW